MNPSNEWAQIKNSKITEDVKAETDQKQRNQTRCKICGVPYLLCSERKTLNEVSARVVSDVLVKPTHCVLRRTWCACTRRACRVDALPNGDGRTAPASRYRRLAHVPA